MSFIKVCFENTRCALRRTAAQSVQRHANLRSSNVAAHTMNTISARSIGRSVGTQPLPGWCMISRVGRWRHRPGMKSVLHYEALIACALIACALLLTPAIQLQAQTVGG